MACNLRTARSVAEEQGGDCESEDARRNLYNMDAVFVSAGIF